MRLRERDIELLWALTAMCRVVAPFPGSTALVGNRAKHDSAIEAVN